MDSSVGVLSVSLHVVTLLFFLFLVSSVYADNSSALLSPPYCFYEPSVCLMSLQYPLERADLSSDSCGYPGFEVDCNYQSGQKPFINISNHIYHVLYIDYESKYIKLVDIDAEGSGGGCPQPKRNFSFPSSPSWVNYRLYTNEDNITIFYNCSRVPVDAEKHLLCSKQDTNTPPSYAFYGNETRKGFDWCGNCAQNVVVPVFFSKGDGSNYSAAIKEGFFMGWSATDWCEDCERSGGRCWANSTATGCACKDNNSYKKTCPPEWCIDCKDSGGQCWSNSTGIGCTCKNNKSFNFTCLPHAPSLHRGQHLELAVGPAGNQLWKFFECNSDHQMGCQAGHEIYYWAAQTYLCASRNLDYLER